jgi:peptidoglycan hydrolase CwlO-like protein
MMSFWILLFCSQFLVSRGSSQSESGLRVKSSFLFKTSNMNPQKAVLYRQTTAKSSQSKIESSQSQMESSQYQVESSQSQIESSQSQLKSPQSQMESSQSQIESSQSNPTPRIMSTKELSP